MTSGDVLDRVADRLAVATRVVALTGAGISTDSGIPDFRGPQGVWTKDPAAERASHIDVWIAEAAVRRAAWADRLARFRAGSDAGDRLRPDRTSSSTAGAAPTSPGWPDPNAGHRALVDLADLGRLSLIVTQNIDGLHVAAGSDPDRVVEVHGTAREVVCLSCDRRVPTATVLDRVADGDDDPHCANCGGLLKSATISFGQALVPRDLQRAETAAALCDVFLALGTSLAVHPVALLPAVARRAGALVVIVNGEPTEADHLADEVVHGGLGEVLPDLVARVRDRLAGAA